MRIVPVLTLVSLVAACKTEEKRPNPVAPREDPVQTAAIARGKYLVEVSGCGDCHTPKKFDAQLGMPVPDPTHLLAGHPQGAPGPGMSSGKTDAAVIGPTFTSFQLPFGTVYAANLTPDPETGLGQWSEEELKRALRTGRHRGAENGRPILPPMPWLNVAAASDQDLSAIHAYLRSIPPVKNAVPEPEAPPPVLAGLAESYGKLTRAQKL